MNTLKGTFLAYAKGSTKALAYMFRFYFPAALLGSLSVALFQPSATPGQAAAFIFVPLAVFGVFLRTLISLLSFVVTENEPAPPISLKMRVICSGVLLAIVVTCVGIPSMYIYSALGMAWAGEFAERVCIISLASILCSLVVGASVKAVFRSAARAIFLVRRSSSFTDHNKHPLSCF